MSPSEMQLRSSDVAAWVPNAPLVSIKAALYVMRSFMRPNCFRSGVVGRHFGSRNNNAEARLNQASKGKYPIHYGSWSYFYLIPIDIDSRNDFQHSIERAELIFQGGLYDFQGRYFGRSIFQPSDEKEFFEHAHKCALRALHRADLKFASKTLNICHFTA